MIANAGNSTTYFLGYTAHYEYTPPLSVGSEYVFSELYVCSYAHNYTTTSDYFSVISEGNETNNQQKVYIDCII